MNAELAGVVGRDGTFTDRTEIWEMVTSMQTNPLVGTGYESFWLGDRLNTIWQSKIGGINEAHDGYLEVYLNLGIIGLALLMIFLIGSYRAICRQLATDSFFPSLALAIWIVAVIYNITESAFKSHFMWVVLLLAAIHLSTGVHDAVGESEESELPGEPEEELVAPGAWSTGTA
jgi:O-antigen ligase